MTDEMRPRTLTADERAVLGKRKILHCDRAAIPHLWEPFQDAYLEHVRPSTRAGRIFCRPSASVPR